MPRWFVGSVMLLVLLMASVQQRTTAFPVSFPSRTGSISGVQEKQKIRSLNNRLGSFRHSTKSMGAATSADVRSLSRILLVPENMRHRRRRQSPAATALQLSNKNWDEILANIDDEEKDNESLQSKIPVDMRYNERNCNRASKNFLAMKDAGAPGADIYGCVATQDDETVFYFLGKVAHVSDVTLEQCVARQWPLIQQHAANLRPIDLFPAASTQTLELWCAPIDSELDVAYNRPSIIFQKMERRVEGADSIKTTLIGFHGEVYERGEEGFRTYRYTADGRPSRPEITASPMQQEDILNDAATDTMGRAPTDEEMERLQKAMEGKDINEVYEEQERRRKEQES